MERLSVRCGVALMVTWLAWLVPLSASRAQTLLPPDPSQTVGRSVSFEGFVDEQGRDAASLIDAPGGSSAPRAWIISPIFTRCQFTCVPITTALRSALRESGLRPTEYRVLSFSFDPEETSEGLQAFRTAIQLPADWLTLRAGSSGALERTLKSLDFRTIKMGDGQFAHPNLIVLLAPDMRLTEYIFGVTFSPTQLAAAVRAARTGGSWWRGGHSYLLVISTIGLLVSTFVFFTILLRRRRV
jgi:cytochrome oxidase Cu insertion factor (SCO1/SenC/PrrC family)